MKTKTDAAVSILALLLILWICLSGSCKPTGQKEQDQQTPMAEMVEDTQKIEQIEALISAISTSPTVHNTKPQLVRFENDTIGYWVHDNEPARIELKLYLPQQMTWQSYFIDDGNLVFVRSRYMQETQDSSYATESMIYLDKEKVFFCKERHMDLSQGQNLARLMLSTPLEKSTRPVPEIEEEVMKYWPAVRKAVMDHHAARRQ
jgi:hypothetical protein